VGAGVGVAVGRGVGIGVGVAPGLGVGLAPGVGVACAALVGFVVGVPDVPGATGVDEADGARATGGCDVDPRALCGPSTSHVIHKSRPTPTRGTSRRSNHIRGTPPTHY
jgi:hypothetical protein